MTSGMPASRSASIPAAMASLVDRSSAGMRSAATPNSPSRSNALGPSGQLDDLRLVVDRLERRVAVLPLHEAGDVLAENPLALVAGDRVDELLPRQDARGVPRLEDVLGAWQPHPDAGHDDGTPRRRRFGRTDCVDRGILG